MADKKISALTAASTPLAGTEVLPIVQSSTTVKVSVDNLTAGKAVSASSFAATGSVNAGGGSGAVYVAPNGSAVAIPNGLSLSTGYGVSYLYSKNSSGAVVDLYQGCANWQGNGNQYVFKNQADTSTYVTIASDANVTLHTGNLLQGTAAKGVDFRANTPAAGKTSTLLNWYEEGTWTPTQGAGLTVVGAFSSAGYYTRVGNVITVTGTVTGATSVALAANAQLCGGLPYTEKSGSVALGLAMNSNTNSSAGIYVSTTTLNSVSALSAAGTIYFSATYLV